MVDALVITVVGMSVVFTCLILISIIISSFKYINQFEAKKSNESNIKKDVVVEQKEIVQKEEVLDLELVAVITAAVATSLNTTSDHLKVRSIRHVKKWQYHTKLGN
ncbi:MAG: OadG family protein [Eubacteriales bacterium]